MTQNRRWNLVRALIELLIVAAFMAVVVRPGSAQQTTTAAAQDTTPLTLVFVIFPDTTAAQNAMTSLSGSEPSPTAAGQPDNSGQQPPNTVGNPANVEWIEPYYAMVSKDRNGKVAVQRRGEKGTTARDVRAENSIDGVVALLGERPSKNNQSVSGAGATRAGISSANMNEMQNMLTPGNTALILVVEHPNVPGLTSELKQAGATQVYDAPQVGPAQ
jgi:hypothetical protein